MSDSSNQDYQLDFPAGDQAPTEQFPSVDEPFESIATGFLKDVAEQDRPIVEKYVKDWDGNVTKRFQEIHSRYEPYKDLGDIEEISAAMQLKALLNEDPRGFYQRMTDALKSLEEQGMLDPEGTDDFTGGEPVEEEQQQQTQYNNDPAMMARLDQMEQLIQGLSTNVQAEQQTRAEAQAIAELDQTMAALHTKYGKFDDENVLMRVATRGIDPEVAVQQYKEWYNKEVGTQARPTPPRLFGGGGHPGGQTDLSKMTKAQRLQHIVDSVQNSE